MQSRAPLVSTSEALLQHIWTPLKNEIKNILKENTYSLEFEYAYRSAYTMVLHKHGKTLYNGFKEIVQEHLVNKVRVDVLNSLNNNFSQTLNQAWNRHQTSMVIIRDILMYMERVYVQQNDLDGVCKLELNLFREHVVHDQCIREHLKSTLKEMIENGPRGEAMDTMEIHNASQMLSSLGSGPNSLYQEIFGDIAEKT